MTDIEQFDPDLTPATKQSINVLRHIDIKQLIYVGTKQAPITTKQPQIAAVLAEDKPTPRKQSQIASILAEDTESVADKPTPKKISIKKPFKITVQTKTPPPPEIPVQSKTSPPPEVPVQSKTPPPPEVSKVPMPIYDKNPTWTKRISELAEEIDPSWDPIFKDPKVMGLLVQLDRDFDKEMKGFGDFIEILPIPQSNIFNAFKKTKFPPKAVIVGQDVYTNPEEAMGLSFSVPDGVKIPPSLINIFKELSTDITGFKPPTSGDLTHWAESGVLLFNAALTIRCKQKESHLKIWKPLTDTIIQLITERSETSIVFMLWGSFAKNKKSLIQNQNTHLILEATHPSPLGANQGGWFGCRHFSQCNQFLIKHNIQPINW